MAGKARTTRTPKKAADWKPAFIAALEACPDVSAAARHAGIGRRTAYDARQRDETFALQWADAINSALDDVESALIERAKDKDTTAAIFLLKSHRPAIYGDRQEIKHSGSLSQDLTMKSDAELREIANSLAERMNAAR